MMPQADFLVLAPIVADREGEMRRLLESMNDAPGRLKADQTVIPFHLFDRLHMARLLIVDDETVGDNAAYGLPTPKYPLYLAFAGDVDGDADAFLREVAAHAAPGLRMLFACCQGFEADTDLLAWMQAHRVRSAASYVNWIGRTVRRVREEALLRGRLAVHIQTRGPEFERRPASEIHGSLRTLIAQDIAAGLIALTPEERTPVAWELRNIAHLLGVPLLFVLLSPLLVVLAIVGVIQLRRLEATDPELCARTNPAHAAALALIEDHDVSNQFSAMGSLKPGMVRLWTTSAVLLAIDYAARHIYVHGRLARVRTIHFARWVFLDDRKRILFLSNYDGSLESYMDDFINKVGFGLNVVFSNGIGYPRTQWLIAGGCRDERKFKEYLRRHQMPTQVWYKAYPGLTAIELERNVRIRQGLEAVALTDREAREWVALL